MVHCEAGLEFGGWIKMIDSSATAYRKKWAWSGHKQHSVAQSTLYWCYTTLLSSHLSEIINSFPSVAVLMCLCCSLNAIILQISILLNLNFYTLRFQYIKIGLLGQRMHWCVRTKKKLITYLAKVYFLATVIKWLPYIYYINHQYWPINTQSMERFQLYPS